MDKMNFSKELSKLGYKSIAYWSKAQEKTKRFYVKDTTNVIYDSNGIILKILR